jgi:hypothetical protein
MLKTMSDKIRSYAELRELIRVSLRIQNLQMQNDSQVQRSVGDWDHDEDGFYAPPLSPGWNGLNH